MRTIKSKVLDAAADLRKDLSTFSKQLSTELSRKSDKQLFVLIVFDHGFQF
jgi:dTDP-4-dehydrorhamnose 3,5-epimerase-like enzyme